jgi:hypothetical protein
MYPGISSCTLKQIGSGVYTGATAHVDADGTMTVMAPGGAAVGTYKIHLTDSLAPPAINSFNLYRGSVDTLISSGNGIRHTIYSGGEVYYIQVYGGSLPMDSYTKGVFVDSI